MTSNRIKRTERTLTLALTLILTLTLTQALILILIPIPILILIPVLTQILTLVDTDGTGNRWQLTHIRPLNRRRE